VDRRGGNRLHRIDHTTGTVEAVDLAGPGQADDHNGAAVAVDPAQGTVLTAYSRHNVDTHVRIQAVDRATMAAGTQQQVDMGGNVTYAQLLHRAGTVHLICRAGAHWRYRTSPDWGSTWGPVQTLIDGTGIGQNYLTTRPDPGDPDLVHLAHYGHPTTTTYRNVGYARLNLATGQLTRLDGSGLGNLADPGGPAVDPTSMDIPIAPSAGFRVRLLDLGRVGDGPAIGYVVWKPDDPTWPPMYKVKYRSGGGWTSGVWELPAGDVFGFNPGTHYHGGVAIGDDAGLWTSRLDATGRWVLDRWDRDGATWTVTAEVDRSLIRRIRPYAVRNPGSASLVYQDCLWDHYTRYYGDLVVS
jgi:hypothetical protein